MSYSTHIQEKSQSHGWFCVNKRNLAQWRYTEYASLLQGNCFFIRFFSEIKKIYSDRKVSLVSTHYFCSTKYCRDPLICERCRFLEDNAVWVNLLIGDNQIKGFLVMITQGCWKMNLSVRKSISCAKIFIFHQRQKWEPSSEMTFILASTQIIFISSCNWTTALRFILLSLNPWDWLSLLLCLNSSELLTVNISVWDLAVMFLVWMETRAMKINIYIWISSSVGDNECDNS